MLLCSETLSAQRVRPGDSFVVPNGQIAPPVIGVVPPGQSVPSPQSLTLPQVTIGSGTVPTANGQPVLPTLQSPYPQYQSGVTASPPSLIQPPAFAQPTVYPQGAAGTVPMLTMPGANPQPVQPPQFIYPPPLNQQPYDISNGSWSNSPSAWPNQAWARMRSSSVYRLFERPRWRQTWLSRNGVSGLGLSETDIATTMTLPNFLYSSQPLRISPGFVFHFWDGPNTPATGADLPGETYSVYLASDYSTPWNRQIGAELNVTVGLYSDFNEVTSTSIRVTGVGLGWYRMSNTTTFKLGIEYLDRIEVKLLPAIGFFIYPTPDLKLDLYFPRPKIAHRIPNVGGYDLWAYVGGEYGGGSWTLKRMAGLGDQADVNDVRAFVGLEWMGPRQVTGFFEVGYVFNREIIYRSAPAIKINIDDSMMLRAGFAF